MDINTIAKQAAEHLGRSNNVYVSSSEPFSSRYLQYLLRGTGNPYQHGVAEVVAIIANGRSYPLPEPIVIANGDGMQDPRGPIHYLALADALAEAGLRTNDMVDP